MNVRQYIGIGLAAAWLLLGFTSGNTPWLSHDAWLVLCALAGGSAVAAVQWRTVHALRIHTTIVITIGTLRSLAYLDAGAYNPLAVWLIVTGLTFMVYHLFRELTHETRQRYKR